ncbi:hypothetical protein DU002_08455 [Corallincola holothuriorum]|uniref:Uncharacterized protein n=1 Tax=Corallincola holothuriorum TaxID=2282215 RepID=A0A368NLE0_9GAMM|nr:hypothetical protein DU002_08455 [Corallincola holothuriorum]
MMDVMNHYISENLVKILDLLSGCWSIKHYQLVHHGWVCTIQNLDNWPKEAPLLFFLHSEQGCVRVCESNQVDSKVFADNLREPAEIAMVINQHVL